MASVTSADLVFYGSATMATTDGVTQGGAINTGIKVTFTDISATDNIKASSTSASDTQNLTITGRNSQGAIISEVLALSGTTARTSVNQYNRILRATISSAPTGIINFVKSSNNSGILTFESGVTGVYRPFYNVSANSTAGPTKNYYEKVFLKNNNTTNALLGAQISQYSDGTTGGADVQFDLENVINGTGTSTDRQTAPTGISSSFSDTAKNVPNTDIAATGCIGIWMKLILPSGVSPQNTTFAFQVSGTTT